MTAKLSSRSSRRPKRMAVPPLSKTTKCLVWALLITTIAIGWVAKNAWAERVSHRQLTLEKQLGEMVIEANNLKQQLLQLSEFARVETEARNRLGMGYPASPPDKVWTEVPVEQPLLGTMAFFSLVQRESLSSRRR